MPFLTKRKSSADCQARGGMCIKSNIVESTEADDEPDRKKLKTEGEYFEVPEAKEDIKLDLELQNNFKTDFEDDLIPKKK